MGSQFLTKAQAGKILEVTPRTIYTWMRQGLLTRVRRGKHVGVMEEEVHLLLKVNQESVEIPFNRSNFLKLFADVQLLKSQMNAVMRILNIRQERLQLTDAEFLMFYKTAQIFAEQGWPPHVEDQWADYFVRMRQEDFDQLHRITTDPNPWKPFYRLASTMLAKPFNVHLRDQLAAGKSSVEMMAGLWCKLHGTTDLEAEQLLKKSGKPSKRLLTRLQKHSDSPR